jgi:hypothetical protein
MFAIAVTLNEVAGPSSRSSSDDRAFLSSKQGSADSTDHSTDDCTSRFTVVVSIGASMSQPVHSR